MPKTHKKFYLPSLLLCLFISLWADVASAEENKARDDVRVVDSAEVETGSTDLVQYWSAWQLLRNGENPYHPEKNAQSQRRAGFSGDTILLRGPPWTLFFLSPVLELPFPVATRVWIGGNLLLLLGSIVLLQSVFNCGRRSFLATGFGGVLFYPVFENVLLGQISLFLLFVICLALWLQKNSRNVLSRSLRFSSQC